jgi:hypothetical protein
MISTHISTVKPACGLHEEMHGLAEAVTGCVTDCISRKSFFACQETAGMVLFHVSDDCQVGGHLTIEDIGPLSQSGEAGKGRGLEPRLTREDNNGNLLPARQEVFYV